MTQIERYRQIRLAVLLAGCLLLWGCPGAEGPGDSPGEVVIGAVFPLSGPNAATGQEIRDALLLAQEIVNRPHDMAMPLAREAGLAAHGGIPVRLICRDSAGRGETASRAVETLATADGAAAILGCYSSAVTATASEQAEILHIPFLNANSTSPILTQRGLKWFFRTTPDDRMFAENFFAFFSQLPEHIPGAARPQRVALVYENRLWGTSVSRIERRLALREGVEIAGDIPYDATDSDFSDELVAVAGAMPGVILQTSYARDAVALMKGYKARGIDATAVVGMNAGFISPLFLTELKGDAEYVFSREVWALDLGKKKDLIRQVNDLYRSRFNRDMTGNSARAFTGFMVLAEAINRAEGLTGEAIRTALVHTDLPGGNLVMPWDGVRFDAASGQNVLGRGIIVQVQNGCYQTVWPWELAERKPVWPVPPWKERGASPTP